MMINVVALGLLLSQFAALLVVVPPEEPSVRASSGYEQVAQPPPSPLPAGSASHILHSARQTVKHAAQEIVCDKEPCPPPSLHDALKHTIHDRYQKTVGSTEHTKEVLSDKIEATKESAKDVYEQAKRGLHEKVKTAKHGVQETAETARHGIHETAVKIKDGMQETVGKIKHGMHETADRIKDGVQGTGHGLHETPGKLKNAMHEVASHVPIVGKDALAMDSVKDKVHEVSSEYLPSKEMAEDAMERFKERVREKVSEMQEKRGKMQDDTARDMDDKATEQLGWGKDKLGSAFEGLKERLTSRQEKKGDGDGLLMKVHELCRMNVRTWVKPDGEALQERFSHLMESARRDIDRAKEIFEKVMEEEGGKWKEKYTYLAESAKGALVGAKEVFERVAMASIEDRPETGLHPNETLVEKVPERLTAHLKEAAIHTKHCLPAYMGPLLRAIYLATFSAAFGIALWMTFLSGYVLACSLPRQQFGLVQSKFLPVYLHMVSVCLLICGTIHAALHPWNAANWWERLQYWNFTFSLAVSLLNTVLVEPKVTKIMFEKLKIEKEEGRGQVGEDMDKEVKSRLTSMDKRFKGLHQFASFTNLATLAGLTWHLWYLANRLLI